MAEIPAPTGGVKLPQETSPKISKTPVGGSEPVVEEQTAPQDEELEAFDESTLSADPSTEQELEPFDESSLVPEKGDDGQQKKITPLVDLHPDLNPDVMVTKQPLPYTIEKTINAFGMNVPVIDPIKKYVPIYDQENRAGIPLGSTPGVPNDKNQLILDTEERQNRDFLKSSDAYLKSGGIPKFENLTLSQSEQLLSPSDAVTPQKYKSYFRPVATDKIPFTSLSKELSGAVTGVSSKMNVDYEKMQRTSKEFNEINSSIKKAKSDIDKSVKSSSEYASFSQSSKAFSDVNDVVKKMNELATKFENTPEAKKYRDLDVTLSKESKAIDESKVRLEELKKKIEAQENTPAEYKEYQTSIEKYNASVKAYTALATEAKDLIGTVTKNKDYTEYQELHGKVKDVDFAKLQSDYELGVKTINEKYATEAEAKKAELEARHAAAKKAYDEVFPASIFGKAKAKYGKEGSEYVESMLVAEANTAKYKSLVRSGIVSEIPSNMPANVKEFLESNTYLNATSREKKYYLNSLFDKNQDKLGGLDRNKFFDVLSGTIIPKLDAVMAKSIASEMLKKISAIDFSKYPVEAGIEIGETKRGIAESKLNAVKYNLESVLNGDYENESGWAKSFYKSWNTEQAIPFVGGVENMRRNIDIKRISDYVAPNGKFEKSKYDKLDQVDKLIYDTHGLVASYNNITNPSFKSQIGGVLSKSIAFMGEMAATSGTSKAFAKGVMEFAPNIVTKIATWSPEVSLGLANTAEVIGKFVNPETIAKASGIAEKMVEVNAQSMLSGTQHIIANTAERLTSENGLYFSNESNKLIQDVNEAGSGDFFTALTKSYLQQLAETGTEHLSDIKLFGTAGLGTKFLNKAEKLTEEEYKILAQATHFSPNSLKAVRGILENTKAGDYMSRLAMSDFVTWVAKKDASISELFNPKNYKAAAVKNFMRDAHFGGFGMEFFEEVVNNRLSPIIENQEDLLYKYPTRIGWKEAKDITAGILPIFIAGGSANLAANIYSKRLGSSMGTVNDFSLVVSNLSDAEFDTRTQALYDKANSMPEGAKELAIQTIEQRKQFQLGNIDGVKAGQTYKEYMEEKDLSSKKLQESLQLIKDGKFEEARAILDEQRVSAPDNNSRDRFNFINQRMNESTPETAFENINSAFKAYQSLDNKIQTFTYLSSGSNPSLIGKEISELSVTDRMKKPLQEAYNKLLRDYNERKKEFGITTIENEAPNEMKVNGFENQEIKFTQNLDGTYTASGIEESDKDASALKTAMKSMSNTVIKALFHSTINSNADEEFKTNVGKAAMSEVLGRIENIVTIDDIGKDSFVALLDSVNSMADNSALSEAEKDSLSDAIRRVFSNSIKIAENADDLKAIQQTAFNLNEFGNILNLQSIVNINSAINRRLLRREATGRLSPVENEENEVVFENEQEIPDEISGQFGRRGETVSNDLGSKLRKLKLGRSKSWDKALKNHSNKANLIKLDKALNSLVSSGAISEQGKNLITSAIMNSGWMQKLISVEGFRVNTVAQKLSSADNFSGTRYIPETKKIVIEAGYEVDGEKYLATESQHVREIVEEILHNVHHNMLLGISGDIKSIFFNEDDVQDITKNSQSDVIKSITDFYSSFKYDFQEFDAISRKSITERTPDEAKLYSEILDYLSYVARQYGAKEDLLNLSIYDKYTGKTLDTKKLVENFRRFKTFRDLGYDDSQALYYSKSYAEFFARIFSDTIIQQEVYRASKSTLDSIIDNSKEWLSDNVRLAPLVRFLKSSIITQEEKNEVFSGMSDYEIEKIKKVQSSIKEFYNEEQKAIYENVHPIMKDLLLEDGRSLQEIVDAENYEGLDALFTELYKQAAPKFGDEAVLVYLEQVLKDLNLQNGRISIDSKTMYDYIVDKFSGEWKGTLEDYFDNTDNALGSMRAYDKVLNDGIDRVNSIKENLIDLSIIRKVNVSDISFEEFKKFIEDTGDAKSSIDKGFEEALGKDLFKKTNEDLGAEYTNEYLELSKSITKEEFDYAKSDYDESDSLGSKRAKNEYYSNTLKAVEDSKLIKASGAKWLQNILSTGGNKTEIERYGLDKFLEGDKSFSKSDITNFLQGKTLDVKDTVLGGEIDKEQSKIHSTLESIKNRLNNDYSLELFSGLNGQNSIDIYFRPKNENGDIAKEVFIYNNEIGFTDYTFNIFSKEDVDRIKYETEEYKKNLAQVNEDSKEDTRWSSYTEFPLNNYREILPTVQSDKKLFSHEHHYSGFQNQLYHNRLNDVTSESGKKLLLSEEMQSDWTQNDKKDITNNLLEVQTKQLAEVEERILNEGKESLFHAKGTVRGEFENETLEERKNYLLSLIKENKDILKKKEPVYSSTSDWVRAAIRKMIIMAVEEGKDGIAWTPAHIHATRWTTATRAVVDEVRFKSKENDLDPSRNSIIIDAYKEGSKTKNFIFMQNREGEWKDNGGNTITEILGKQMANQVLEEKNGEIKGDKILIGAQGFIDVYDKTAVDVANKFAKKYGLQVTKDEKVESKDEMEGLETSDGSKIYQPSKLVNVHSLIFNEALKQDIANQEGIPLFAKRAQTFVVDHAAFATLIANSKNGITVTPQELLDELAKIEINIHKFGKPQKRNASVEANQLVQMWKLQYLKNELPKISKARLSEIVKLTKVPIRAKISDYSKDINFIQKFVKDTTFRKSYEEANAAIQKARKNYSRKFKDNVPFYMAMSKLMKVNLAMYGDNAAALDGFKSMITQDPNKVNIASFESQANSIYNFYIKWKEAPENKIAGNGQSQAQQDVDDNNRNLIKFIKTNAQRTGYKDSYVDKLLNIDENELEGEALKKYINYLTYVGINKSLNSAAYNFTQKYYAEQEATNILQTLDEKFVETLNKKVIGSEIKEWLKGTPVGAIYAKATGQDSLGNISHYNVSDFLGFASEELKNVVLKPLVDNHEKLAGLIRDIMSPLVPHTRGLSQEDMVIIGIHGLMNQKPKLKLSAKAAVQLNDEFNTDVFKSGMELDKNSSDIFKTGYEKLLSNVNEMIAKSIAISYGEVVEGTTQEEAKRWKKIVAERRGISESELEKERNLTLKKMGVDSIYELASNNIALNPESQSWLDDTRKVFNDIRDGVYTGIDLKTASEVRSGDDFMSIDDYFPILRYNQKENFTEFEEDAASQIFYGYSQDFYMNEGFTEKRKPVVMALNTNAWEATGRKIDQQLFYLLNIDHKKFLGKLMSTDLFDGKTEASLSRESTNLVKEMLNTIFNRGVSRSQVAMINSNLKILKGLKEVIDNIKPLYIGAFGNSLAQTSTVITAIAAMKGNPVLRIKNMLSGLKYLPQMFDYDSDMNKLLRDNAREVYYRGLADYQIPMAEEGVIVRSALKGISKGVYDRGSQSYVEHFIDAIKNKNMRTAIQLSGLIFFDRASARISFFELYNNYMDNQGLPIDYANPNKKAVDFALDGVRKTQHTSSDIFQSFIGKGIIPGSSNMNEGEMAAVGDMM